MIPTLVVVFILSGAAGLIYESLWSRYLGLFVGHSAYAQIIVMVIFLGGMSLGAYWVGRRTTRIRSPLMWYAGVEAMVGVLALGFHDAFVGLTNFSYDSLFPSLGGPTLTIVKWGLAGLLILPQSVLLGATFPLMTAGAIRLAKAQAAPGRLLSLLYFANSLGAAGGVLLSGFFLIRAMGLPGTLLIAGFMNVIVAVVVAYVARNGGDSAESVEGGESADSGSPATPVSGESSLARVLLVVSFGTAVASFIYEIAWIRMLSLALGSATHAFELMLSAFILGLAMGALWIRTRADDLPNPIRFLGMMQWIMGVLAIATLPVYIASYDLMSALLHTVPITDAGYRWFLLGRYGIALLVMFPATFCAGTTLPLITRILMRGGSGERAIGQVYAANTLGSIEGIILAGLILMPLLGLKYLLLLGALIDVRLGIWLVSRAPAAAPAVARFPRLVPVALTALLMIGVTLGTRFNPARLSGGVYRSGIAAITEDVAFPFYHDGRTATVAVRKSLDGVLTLATNGKPDASMSESWLSSQVPGVRVPLTGDIATQLLLPLITLAHAPNAGSAAVIGHGSGMTSHVLLGSPYLTEVVTVEIEPDMIRASDVFRPANGRVFDDPRSTFVIDDAKSYFASSGRSFDIIVSEPSNPWVSGVSGLFTEEFYGRVSSTLAPGGVFGQWLHLYELSDGLVSSVLAAIDAVFPAYEVFFTLDSDILIVASNDALPEPRWDVVTYPGIEWDFARVVPVEPESFEALRLAGRPALHSWLQTQAPNSDFFPTLDLTAEHARFLRSNATNWASLGSGRFDMGAALAGRRVGFGTLPLALSPTVARSVGLALGARLRAARALAPDEILELDATLTPAIARWYELERSTEGSSPPPDWQAWINQVGLVDEDLHRGTAGVVDSIFFARIRAYAARAEAPPEVRATIDFLHGIGAWDWEEAWRASAPLLARLDEPWVPPTLLRNGATIAAMKVGKTDDARLVMRMFAQRTSEDPFRAQLLEALLQSGGEATPPPDR